MKKQYVFLFMILIMLYLFYLIINFKYKEYKINESINYIGILNEELRGSIKKADNIIKWKKSNAYINKILKEQQGFKNKGEEVIYLTSEDNYNKYTKVLTETHVIDTKENETINITSSMNNYQKWIYLIFGKDIR